MCTPPVSLNGFNRRSKCFKCAPVSCRISWTIPLSPIAPILLFSRLSSFKHLLDLINSPTTRAPSSPSLQCDKSISVICWMSWLYFQPILFDMIFFINPFNPTGKCNSHFFNSFSGCNIDNYEKSTVIFTSLYV